jgi:HAD superfamily hydrolase (TIGR01509 family)
VQGCLKLFKAVIFDCDGVLVDSEVLALEVELAILREQGLTFDRTDYINRFMGLSYEAFHRVMDEEAVTRIGRPISDTIRDELATRLRQTMIERLTEISGAGAAVASVALPKAVASSSTKEGLERKLRQVGLWDHFAPHVYSADHVARAKPAPDLFLHTAAALGIVPADCLVIEDSVNGVLAAKTAGMRCWGFLGGGHAHDGLAAQLTCAGAERIVANWQDAAQILPSVLSR